MNAIEKMKKEGTLESFIKTIADGTGLCVEHKMNIHIKCGDYGNDCKKCWSEHLTKTYDE